MLKDDLAKLCFPSLRLPILGSKVPNFEIFSSLKNLSILGRKKSPYVKVL